MEFRSISIFFQFAAWVDAVIFVFSLENEASFNAVYNFYTKMSHFRNAAEIPIILVGTQGEHGKVVVVVQWNWATRIYVLLIESIDLWLFQMQ